jgi:hypothetical protein
MDTRRVFQRPTCPATAQRIGPDEDSRGASVPGDRDFLALLDPGQQFGECSASLGDGHGHHDEIVRRFTSKYSNEHACDVPIERARLVTVEGPASILGDLDERMADPTGDFRRR